MQRARCHPRGRSLELAHKAVAATVTEELKLKTFISRVVGVVSGELNQRHGSRFPRKDIRKVCGLDSIGCFGLESTMDVPSYQDLDTREPCPFNLHRTN